jgi:hypothetical protein
MRIKILTLDILFVIPYMVHDRCLLLALIPTHCTTSSPGEERRIGHPVSSGFLSSHPARSLVILIRPLVILSVSEGSQASAYHFIRILTNLAVLLNVHVGVKPIICLNIRKLPHPGYLFRSLGFRDKSERNEGYNRRLKLKISSVRWGK